jgi:hypothetical protein
MNIILANALPETEIVEGEAYPINTDYRVWVQFELNITKFIKTDDERLIIECLKLCFVKKLPPTLALAFNALLDFYKGIEKKENGLGGGKNTGESKRVYCFEHDCELVYAAFLSQYNIDLTEVGNLHWWKFKAMFKGLEESNVICKIMGYRSYKGKDKEYLKLKRMYAIPSELSKEEQKKIEEFEALFD